MIRALALTVSTGAAQGTRIDESGPALAAGLRELGFRVDGPQVVPDGDPVEPALRAAISDGYDLIVTTGGTGLTPDDCTPEATARVVERFIPGIPEALRADGIGRGIAMAQLSRGVAGSVGSSLIINLPGSPGAVREGLAVLGPVLAHALAQLAGAERSRHA